MEHQPFETWLLNDEPLAPEQQRDLRRHMAACPQCAALSRANLSLRVAPLARPANGFALRFERRLAAERKVLRRRAYIGITLLTLTSIGIVLWMISPLLPYFSLSPTQLFISWVSALLYLSTTIQALDTISEIFTRIIFEWVPPLAWGIALLAAGGVGLLWGVSLRKPVKQKAYSRARL